VADVAALAVPGNRDELVSGLGRWLPRQRWFAGKARSLAGVEVADVVLWEGASVTVVGLLCDVAFTDGHHERYQVPLTDAPADADDRWVAVIGRAVRAADATAVPAAARLLAEVTLSPKGLITRAGATVVGRPVSDRDESGNGEGLGPARRLSAEQSNTSIIYGDRLILKLFRRLEPGINPDVEITRALTRAHFPHVPAQHGALELAAPDGSMTTLAVLSDFVAGGREGWELAVNEVIRLRDSPVGCALEDPTLHDALADLGRAVASMHTALRAAFGSRPATREDVVGWGADMRAQLDRVCATAERLAPEAAAAMLGRRSRLEARLEALLSGAIGGELVRIHGDLHLGQVLADADGRWQILDFEGEPVRSLEERRAPSAALRDVAGMLRSFDYAAATGGVGGSGPPHGPRGVGGSGPPHGPGGVGGAEDGALPEAVAAWRDEARRRFLDGYFAEAAGGGFLPEQEQVVAAQLALFELDKAVYELGYELANRPHWIAVPIGGMLRVLDSAAPG
jgi:maltokinase